MSARCDFSDLPVESCAHCTGRTGDTTADLEIAVRFVATYDGRCAACSDRFSADDRIGRTTDGEYVCGGCAG